MLKGPKGILLGISIALAVVAVGRHTTGQSSEKNTRQNTEQSEIQFSAESSQVQSGAASRQQSTIPQVTLHTAQLTTVENRLTLTGTVTPENLLRITPQLDGLKITEMLVEPGDAIAAGQSIAVLDDRMLRAQLSQAQAQLTQAESELRAQEAAIAQAKVLEQAALTDVQRYSTLYQQGAVSQEQLGERQVDTFSAQQNVETALALRGNAQAKIASQLAAIDQLKTQLEQTVVLAPAAGVIAHRHATLGETVSATTPLYSLIENNQLILTVTPSQSQLAQIELNAPVSIRSTSRANQLSLTGSVKSIDPILTENSRQATVKIALSGNSAALRPGMFLQANIQTSKGRSIVVPATAVITQTNGESIVYTVEKASPSLSSRQNTDQENAQVSDPIDSTENAQEIYTAIAHSVKTVPFSATGSPQSQTSEQTQNYVQVLSGLSAGDRIVTGGASYLQSGDRVTLAAPPAAPPAASSTAP